MNECFVQAVQARSEHDLRVGAAFTRFQTLLLQKHFDEFADGSQGVVSYGPCQFPTLGFVVERWARIETFVPEEFWYLDMSIRLDANGAIEGAGIGDGTGDAEREGLQVQPQHGRGRSHQGRPIYFKWKRERLYDQLVTMALYESCLNAEEATVISLTGPDTKRASNSFINFTIVTPIAARFSINIFINTGQIIINYISI